MLRGPNRNVYAIFGETEARYRRLVSLTTRIKGNVVGVKSKA